MQFPSIFTFHPMFLLFQTGYRDNLKFLVGTNQFQTLHHFFRIRVSEPFSGVGLSIKFFDQDFLFHGKWTCQPQSLVKCLLQGLVELQCLVSATYILKTKSSKKVPRTLLHQHQWYDTLHIVIKPVTTCFIPIACLPSPTIVLLDVLFDNSPFQMLICIQEEGNQR